MTELKKVVVTPDGKQFDTMKEAQDYLRRPKIKAELMKVTEGNEKLVDWLIDNQETVEMAFEVGTIRRVTKVERNKLKKALDAIKEASEPKFKFVQENADSILETFRWPSVTRMKDEEKTAAARASLIAASEGNEKLADYILQNKDAIVQAYQAGVEKREVNPKATKALEEYRAKKAAEKLAKELAEGKPGVETHPVEKPAA